MKEESKKGKIGKHYVHFDGCTWPSLDMGTDDIVSLEWVCRYYPDGLTKQNLLVIASIISAYNTLIVMPQARRNKVCKSIRELSL